MSYTADTWPADRWPNFSFTEMACSETGECGMDKATMDRLQLLRSHYGSPLTITSGYRSPRHSIEAAKAAPAERPRCGLPPAGSSVPFFDSFLFQWRHTQERCQGNIRGEVCEQGVDNGSVG